MLEYIRTKFFKKKVPAWKINYDDIYKDAAKKLADYIDKDILDNVYKDAVQVQVEESVAYWVKMQEQEVKLQIKMGLSPEIQEWPMFSHKTIDKDGNPVTQVVSQCVIGETKIRLDTNFKA
jgi:hypothetical protein